MATVLDSWREVLLTQNLSAARPLDPVSRWLLITRASVFSMTLTSALIGGLLALAAPGGGAFHAGHFLLALVGLVAAHAANNMINDYFDLEGGVDSDQSVRAQYAPHPILAGLVSERGLLAAIAVANLVDLAVLIVFVDARGPLVLLFALAGLFISVFYVAPPLRLKHRGLGEPGVFIVWGPLMIGGVYYVTTGSIAPWVFVASLPFAVLVMAVLVGKHVDKYETDAARGTRTLPVRIGERPARRLNQALFLAFFALVAALALGGTLGVWTLLALFALPRLARTLRIYGRPRPAQPPAGFPIWPLWYVAWAFHLTRLAGGLFVLGLALSAVLPVYL